MTDNQWIEDIYCEYYSFLYILGARYLLGHSVQISGLDDSIQNVFMQMVRKRNKLETHPNIKGWLIVALRRELSSQIGKERKGKKRFAFSLDDDSSDFQKQNALADNLSDPEFLCVDVYQEKLEEVEKLVGKDNADLLMQCYVNDVSLSELAQQKHIGETALKMRIFRLKEKIRSHPEIFLLFAFFALLLPR